MKYFPTENSNYKTLFPLIIISGATLLMLVAGAASSISSNYQYVYAAVKNKTNTATDESTSDTTTTTKNTPSPIGSKTFMTVTGEIQVTNGPPDGTWLEIDVYHACVKLSRLYDC